MSVTSITPTYNEEDTIDECLDSISWCDEHIVIDEFSDDNTVEVAEAHGAKVYQKKTPSDANCYEIVRRFGVQKASNDWILRLDADERSHPCLNSRLQSLVKKEIADVIMVPRVTYLGDTWIDHGRRWWPDRSPIVFEKGSIEITDTIHRSLNIQSDAQVVQLPAEPESAVYHYSYDSYWDLIRKRWRYAQTSAQGTNDSPKLPLFWAFRAFLESYFVDKGFRNGLTGLNVACLDSLYHLAVFYHKIR